MADHLIEPHGSVLVDLLVDDERARELKEKSIDWVSIDLTRRQLCDFELLANGGFSPLRGFQTRRDYERVCSDMRLSTGELWPIPVTLDVSEAMASEVSVGSKVALRDEEGWMLGVLDVEEIWRPDKEREAELVLGTTNPEHPGVKNLLEGVGPVYIGGSIDALALPAHYDYRRLRLTPSEVRAEFVRRGWTKIVAFQTRNPMHRAHVELTMRAAAERGADVLIHPVVGMTKPGDVDHYTRVRCYQAVLERYPRNTATLALLALAMRMAGPREAVWHAIIRKNHGCTHLIVGRDHAGPGSDSRGTSFYGPYDAQELLREHEEELGVSMVDFRMLVYDPEADVYVPVDEVKEDTRTLSISGTELRERLADGRDIPDWFTYPEVVSELRRTHPPRWRQGITVFFTGLSGSGKSTVANALRVKLLEIGGRPVTLLDGDIVRKNLSSELGFSRQDRDLNIERIGFVASEITKNGGIAICAPIAPYDSTRKKVRRSVEGSGGFVLVHIATPLEVCEERDRKGLYAKARAGLIKEFTGISDPYEEPTDAELVIDTSEFNPDEAANQIVVYLQSIGFLVGSDES